MIQRFDDAQDVMDYWSTLEFEVYQDCWREFRSKPRPKVQQWEVMSSSKFIKLVRRAYDGELTEKDKVLIDEYTHIIFYNWCKLEFNSIMVGHTEREPAIELAEREIKATKTQLNILCDWIEYDAFSDYGLQPIAKLLTPMMLQKNYSLKVQIMADIIGITHMRGDLARFFVEDGRRTHAKIDVYECTCD